MAERALVLGGGGPVGIAWEIGLAAGLAEQGIELAKAGRIVGTSAGSFVGAQLASGRSPASLVASQVEQAQRDAARKGSGKAPASAPDLSPLMKFMARRPADEVEAQALRVEIGAFALAAKTMPEEAFIASFGHVASGKEGWPTGYACTAVDAEDGRFVVWDEHSGIELGRGIASSCSVPGIFPPITIKGRRYVDGGMRSATNFDLAKGCERVLAVAVLSNAAVDFMRARIEGEVEALRASGAKVELVTPNQECLDAFGLNLMDGSRRGEIAAAGVRQGRAEVERLRAFWN
ncbi:MAG TPA: patatin-like phospholipase family protein [Rhizomicrobium sp.]